MAPALGDSPVEQQGHVSDVCAQAENAGEAVARSGRLSIRSDQYIEITSVRLKTTENNSYHSEDDSSVNDQSDQLIWS